MGISPGIHRYVIAAAFFTIGILHFVRPQFFLRIVPDFIPYHLAMVYISGAAEVLGGIGILVTQTRTWAAWGLILLLVAVFPANINMTVMSVQESGYTSWYSVATILRLPLQFVLMYWVYWACLR
ncbi:DoxX family protein [Fodinibius saliphilus]|uniref:DoxX family protein n=1 Tax=Fodinibius saliphilus TaxID=1920650 RepID=UPI0011086258|nr:DoxX family protein [Fodinibius saliphilus]